MNAHSPIRRLRDDFPGVGDWHYLDSAATAQKPQVVVDAIAAAYGPDYATVHRGVYQRSSDMTRRYEAARARLAEFIGGRAEEVVFLRGATEAINLVARSWLPTVARPGGRILLSALEHHANIVPWQMAAAAHDLTIDVCPLTDDGRVDLDAAEAMLTRDHLLVSLCHVSNVLGSQLDASRAAALAHSVGAKLLLDGCQAGPRTPVDVSAIGCDFYALSGHKLYGPTGIGALWGRAELLDAMPPIEGGGSMIDRVSWKGTTYAPPPGRFEAGTPHIVGAVGLHAALDYIDQVGLPAIHETESALVARARDAMRSMNSVRLFGPEDSLGIVSFEVEGVHPHDVATILDEGGVAVRAGHHCAQPLMRTLRVDATVRASFALYSDEGDVDALLDGLDRVRTIFG